MEDSTNQLHSSDIVHDCLDGHAETNNEITGNVQINLQTKDDNEPIQESGPKYLLKQCVSCNQSKTFLNESSLSCYELNCTECKNENSSFNSMGDQQERLFDTMNNRQSTDLFVPCKEKGRWNAFQGLSQNMDNVIAEVTGQQKMCEPCTKNEKTSIAIHFRAECENEILSEACGKNDTKQKSTRSHILQDKSQYVNDLNSDTIGNSKLCEPCTANDLSIPACYFCAKCENELLCETCGNRHRIQKSTRTHNLQDICQYVHVPNSEIIVKLLFCELCTANKKSSPACFFCAECENEFLCETCGKNHKIQKSTRTHKLQDISEYIDVSNSKIIAKQRFCVICTANLKSNPAFYFCAECEDEFLCEKCGKHHNIQKSTQNHKLKDISQYVEVRKADVIAKQRFCELCTANLKSSPAFYFCAECENEFLCYACGKNHNFQKSTRTHILQDMSHYVEDPNVVTRLCDICIANEKSIPAFYFCAECDNEFLCDACGKNHNIQKSTRTHILKDLSHYIEVPSADAMFKQRLCELCTANGKSSPAFYFCAECENERLCVMCGKNHNVQKSTRTHTLKDIIKYVEAENTEVMNEQKLCEPCKANKKASQACYFCIECENELLCETCRKHHLKQKSTRTHKLQDISQYLEVFNADVTTKQKFCEPCTANQKSTTAIYFCANCENEFLCKSCGKHHNVQQSTRKHQLQDITQYVEAVNTKVNKMQLLCELCKKSPACYFCAKCQNECLCDACGKHHNTQKSTRNHRLKDINQYVGAFGNQFSCEPCSDRYHISRESSRGHTLKNMNQYVEKKKVGVDNQPDQICESCYGENNFASSYCAECDKMLCKECGIYHTENKLFRTHVLQKFKNYVKIDINETNMKLCEPCLVLGKTNAAIYICNACKSEKLCKNCGINHTKLFAFRKHVLEKIDSHQHDAVRSSDSVHLDSTPGQPAPIEVGFDTITLTWKKPASFKKGDHFQIACRENNDAKWKIIYDNVETNTFTLSNMKSDSQFVFRIRAVYNGEESNYSKESDIVTTRKSLASQIVGFCTVRSAENIVPVEYELPMTEVIEARNSQAKTRRFEIGSPKKVTSMEKTILLVGETGTGKSTLVNGMANFILGVNWNDMFRFTMVHLDDDERNKKANQAVSQTEWITCYTMHPQEDGRLPYTINIIDTPGFGDTRGLQRDHDIVEQIRKLFSVNPPLGIVTIDAVCFLIKAPDARLTPTQSYIFQSIMSLFGKDIEENICSLITFADGQDPPVLSALKESNLSFGEWFTFNNSALFANNSELKQSSLSPMFWEMGLKSFQNFFKYLNTLHIKSLQLTSEVLNERFILEATIKNLEPLLDSGLIKINERKCELKCFEENQAIIADNKDFKYTVKTTKQLKKPLPIGEHVTNCLNCNFTCHHKCKIAKDEDKNKCLAMDQNTGYCKICPEKCIWNKHVNTPYIFEYIVVDEEKTYAEMQKKYQDASGKLPTQKQLLEKMDQELNDMLETVDVLMAVVNACNARLAEIALRPNPLTATEHIDVLIENERMLRKEGWPERIKSLEMVRKRALIPVNVDRFREEATEVCVSIVQKSAKLKDILLQKAKDFFSK